MTNRAVIHAGLITTAVSLALPGLAPQIRHGPLSVLEGVTELEKPVTYTQSKIPLGELVQKVADDTGVKLTTAKDVADEPVAVVVKDFPARELLEQLADLLDYRWSRRSGASAFGRSDAQEGGTPQHPNTSTPQHLPPERPNARTPERPSVRYEIWQDLASKQREEALRQSVLADAEKRFREEVARVVEIAALWQEQVEAILSDDQKRRDRMTKLAPEERRALAGSPEERQRSLRVGMASRMRAPLARVMGGLVGRLTGQQWATLLREQQPLLFSTDPTPGELPLPADLSRAIRTTRPGAPGRRRPPGDAEVAEWSRRHEQEQQERWAAATGFRATIQYDAANSKPGSLVVNLSLAPVRTGTPFRAMSWSLEDGTWVRIAAEAPDVARREEVRSPERRAVLEKDPVLGARRVFRSDATASAAPWRSEPARTLQDLLPDLARVYHVQFLADAYWNAPSFSGTVAPRIQPVALFTLLSWWAEPTYDWDRHGALLRLRSRSWYFDRPREVPLRQVRRWQEECARAGSLSLDAFAAAAARLPDAQREGLRDVIMAGALPAEFEAVHQARYALLLYGALAAGQRQPLLQGASLPVAQMSPPQRDLFLAALQERRRGWGFSNVAPPDLLHWTAGHLSMTVTPMVRICERRGETVRYRDERGRPPDGAPRTALQAAPPTPTHSAPQGASTRYPITEVQVNLHHGSEVPVAVTLIAASP